RARRRSRRVVLLGRRDRQTRVVNRLGRAPSEAGGVAFGCAGTFRIGLQSGCMWHVSARIRKYEIRGQSPVEGRILRNSLLAENLVLETSLLTGKLTGNFAESGPPLLFSTSSFPTQRNREFLNAYQGIFFEEQGI